MAGLCRTLVIVLLICLVAGITYKYVNSEEFVGGDRSDTFISHTHEPAVGERIINTNPNCIHYMSKGTVISVDSLEEGKGKTALYIVENNGPNYIEGQTLCKTMDQLSPYPGIYT